MSIKSQAVINFFEFNKKLKNRVDQKGEDMAESLVVTSKVKKYIKENASMNTSAETIDMLSKAVEQLCKKGIESAKAEGRKTVMARDIVIDHL